MKKLILSLALLTVAGALHAKDQTNNLIKQARDLKIKAINSESPFLKKQLSVDTLSVHQKEIGRQAAEHIGVMKKDAEGGHGKRIDALQPHASDLPTSGLPSKKKGYVTQD